MTTATEPLTARQREVHRWMLAYQAEHQMPPTVREVMRAHGMTSPNGALAQIKALAKKGAVRINGKALSRAAVAVDLDARRCECCGQPIHEPENGADA